MAKKSKDAYGAEGQTNELRFDPEKLTLVVDENHPLYDARVHNQFDEAMVLNIMHYGVMVPIVIAKDTETGLTVVVDGRQRVINTREANRRLRNQGRQPVLVPATIRRAAGADLAGVMVSTNELRQDDTPLGRAVKMARIMGFGKTEEELSIIFGCTLQTVKNTLALLDCPKVVRDAVEVGRVNVGHALALSKLPVEEQREKLAALLVAGEGAKPHERARKQRAIVKPGLSGFPCGTYGVGA